MMRWSLPLAMLGLLAGCACKAPADHADANIDLNGIERIQIEYRHMGWDNIEEHYTLVPRGEGFVLRFSYESRNHVQRNDSRTVPIAMVRGLIAAVRHLNGRAPAASTSWPPRSGRSSFCQRVKKHSSLRQNAAKASNGYSQGKA